MVNKVRVKNCLQANMDGPYVLPHINLCFSTRQVWTIKFCPEMWHSQIFKNRNFTIILKKSPKITWAALRNSRGCPAIFLQPAIFPPRFLVPVRMAKVILTGLRPPPLPGRTAHLFVDALAQAHPDRTLSLYVSIYVSIYTHAQPLSSYLYRIYVSILSTYLYTFIPMYGCNIRQCWLNLCVTRDTQAHTPEWWLAKRDWRWRLSLRWSDRCGTTRPVIMD